MHDNPYDLRASVTRTERVRLRVTRDAWPFAVANRERSAEHWRGRSAENPAFFNGRVFVQRQMIERPDGVEGVFSLENFADFLLWRDLGRPDESTLDGFGSALVRSAEGYALLGRNGADTLNPGKVYLPGGFLDARDVRGDDTIDLDASVARELAEETGLDAGGLERVPGYIVARLAHYCCFAVEFRSKLGADELRALMLAGAARDTSGELADIVIIRNRADLARYEVLGHARLLLDRCLGPDT